jgi:hypothetical protein
MGRREVESWMREQGGGIPAGGVCRIAGVVMGALLLVVYVVSPGGSGGIVDGGDREALPPGGGEDSNGIYQLVREALTLPL